MNEKKNLPPPPLIDSIVYSTLFHFSLFISSLSISQSFTFFAPVSGSVSLLLYTYTSWNKNVVPCSSVQKSLSWTHSNTTLCNRLLFSLSRSLVRWLWPLIGNVRSSSQYRYTKFLRRRKVDRAKWENAREMARA